MKKAPRAADDFLVLAACRLHCRRKLRMPSDLHNPPRWRERVFLTLMCHKIIIFIFLRAAPLRVFFSY
jgi:hypothetical protein